MTQILKIRTHYFILMVFILAAVPVVSAQEGGGISREALYNSADGFHVLIPQGWDNQSISAYAHFVHPETQVSIYAGSAATTDVQAGIADVLSQTVPDVTAEPLQTGQVILSNGTWTQNIYQPSDDSSLTAYGQVYEDSTYVVLWHSPQSAIQPVIVPSDEVEAGISQALNTLGYVAGEPTATEEIEIGEQVWTRNVYEDATALARVRGDSTHVIVASGELASGGTALPAFFNLLTGFFLTPATAPYLYLGVGAVAVIAVIYIGTLLLRTRNLRKDIETLEALESDSRATA
jgi:hypothetical protein